MTGVPHVQHGVVSPIDLASMLRCLLSLRGVFLAPLAGRAAFWPATDGGLSWALSWNEADGSSAGLPPAARRLPGVEVNLLGLAGIDWRRSGLKRPAFGRVGGDAVADKTPARRLALRRGLG